MGHDSMRAALIYQHKTSGADRRIADAIESLSKEKDQESFTPPRRCAMSMARVVIAAVRVEHRSISEVGRDYGSTGASSSTTCSPVTSSDFTGCAGSWC